MAVKAVGGRSYQAMQAVGLYPTSGASDDYAFSRFWAKSGANKVSPRIPLQKRRFPPKAAFADTNTQVYGFTMEFGYSTNFYPTLSEFNQNILDTNAGFMDWALAAIGVGLD